MGLRKLIRNTFGFSRSQANGFVVLLPLVTVILFSEPAYRWWVSQRDDDFSNERVFLDSLSNAWQAQQQDLNSPPVEADVSITYFNFDPNIAAEEELKALGFSQSLTKRLIHYREKGGRFRVKSDLKKLYGMDSVFYQSLAPFIALPADWDKPTLPPVTGKKKLEAFDLNKADTTQLKSIYGIGSKLAGRIVKYREKLGGFVRQSQLSEVYGLDSTAIHKLTKASFLSEDFNPTKININTADEDVLSAHPYLTKKIAKAIVAYRYQHGNFQSIEDCKQVRLMDDSLFEKLNPYLTVGESITPRN